MSMTNRARALRKRMTPQEVKIWKRLKLFRQSGIKFRRQVPIGRFIVDFACFDPKLVIEIDGGQRGDPKHHARDRIRDSWLNGEGFAVLRFWNMDVDRNMDGVLDVVAEYARRVPVE